MLKFIKKKNEAQNTKSYSNSSIRSNTRINKARANTRLAKNENIKDRQQAKRERFEREAKKNENAEFFKKSLTWAAGLIIALSCIIGLSFGFLQLTNYILEHPYFEVENIEISGSSQFTNEEIIQLSGLDGLGESNNYFGIDENAIKGRMLQNTWIQDVNITKEFPNTIQIQVTERRPFFWILHEDQLFYIDTEGQIIAPVKADNFVSLPLLDLGQSPEEALKVLPEFAKGLDARQDMLPFKLSDIVWIRLSAGNGIEMYWEDEEILLAFDITNLKENLDKMIFALQDLKKRNEIRKIAEIHSGNGQVWFVFD